MSGLPWLQPESLNLSIKVAILVYQGNDWGVVVKMKFGGAFFDAIQGDVSMTSRDTQPPTLFTPSLLPVPYLKILTVANSGESQV